MDEKRIPLQYRVETAYNGLAHSSGYSMTAESYGFLLDTLRMKKMDAIAVVTI